MRNFSSLPVRSAMYAFRHLSMEEQDRVVEERAARGFPLHGPPHLFRNKAAYFITATCFEHVHIINTVERLSAFQVQLLETFLAGGAEIHAHSFFSNHYHLLFSKLSLDTCSSVLKRIHGSTARQWNLEDETTGKRKVWYRYRDRYIRNKRHFYRVMNYIHINPVHHGYVSRPAYLPWSSVHWYAAHPRYGRAWLNEIWQTYPPPGELPDWDRDPDLL